MSKFLFSIDLEDVTDMLPPGHSYPSRMSEMTHQYLNFLDSVKSKCTFFVVGDVARKFPDLIKEIAQKGHEIACHSNSHIPVESLNAKSFAEDLKNNIDSIVSLGLPRPIGFRAPILSITEKTTWAHEVLSDLGFKYSSSVLPYKSPMYGWNGFGQKPKRVSNVLEIPVTLSPLPFFKIPIAGGVYFRFLPILINKLFFNFYKRKNIPVISYFHPYDIDYKQERFFHPGIPSSQFYNWLMYNGRKTMLDKLNVIVKDGFEICTYKEYYEKVTCNENIGGNSVL